MEKQEKHLSWVPLLSGAMNANEKLGKLAVSEDQSENHISSLF